MKTRRTDNDFVQLILGLLAGFLLISFCIDTTGETLRKPSFIAFTLAVILIAVMFRKNLPKDKALYAMAAGIFIKLSYVAYTGTWCRQHDVLFFGAGEGHAAYIEYILANRHLPDFDPRTVWAFFQPPLHHMISAAWMWLQLHLGVAEGIAQENVQILTCFYMVVVMLITHAICKELNMKSRGRLITMLIVSLHPMFTMLSGSINNDALALCLSMLAVYITILWYQNPSVGTVILLALSIGFAMFAKLTSVLVAPAIGALMIYSFIKNSSKWKNYILQFAIFGVVVFPIGLYWPLRNMIRFGMPLNYIPEVGEQLTKSDFFSRVFDIRIHSVYPSMVGLGDSYDEYNTIVQMLKSSLFGEYNYGQTLSAINPFAVILFVTSALLAIVSLWATIHMIFSKKSMMSFERKLFLGLLYISFVAGYLSFSLGYNNFSAEDFRYAALSIIIEAIFLGIWADESEEKVARCVLILSYIFAGASFATYFLLGIA